MLDYFLNPMAAVWKIMPSYERQFSGILSDDAKCLWYNNGFTPTLGINYITHAETPKLVLMLS